jgi:hypothetical protein
MHFTFQLMMLLMVKHCLRSKILELDYRHGTQRYRLGMLRCPRRLLLILRRYTFYGEGFVGR